MTSLHSFRSPARQAGSAKLYIVIAAAVVGALAVGGGGTYLLLGHGGGGEAEAEEPQPPAEPTFVAVEPMTVNLSGDNRVLYVGLSLSVENAAAAATLESHMPEVRNRMLIALSDQQADQMTTSQGKRQVATVLREALQPAYDENGRSVAINSVLFTDFIVQ